MHLLNAIGLYNGVPQEIRSALERIDMRFELVKQVETDVQEIVGIKERFLF